MRVIAIKAFAGCGCSGRLSCSKASGAEGSYRFIYCQDLFWGMLIDAVSKSPGPRQGCSFVRSKALAQRIQISTSQQICESPFVVVACEPSDKRSFLPFGLFSIRCKTAPTALTTCFLAPFWISDEPQCRLGAQGQPLAACSRLLAMSFHCFVPQCLIFSNTLN